NNLNDALAWGLTPLYLAAHGASVREIAVVAAAYPVVWGTGQLATGWLSDHTGRKPLITAGMIVQAGALGLLVAGNGAFAPSLAAALLLGAGTAMVYPTLIAAVSDASQPRDRARVVGVYRFWRDFGFVVGALIAGSGADATSTQTAILIVAVLTGASGPLGAANPWQLGRVAPGERLLALGSGAGTDSLIAAQACSLPPVGSRSPTSRSRTRSAPRGAATSISGPAEEPGRCWKQRTPSS